MDTYNLPLSQEYKEYLATRYDAGLVEKLSDWRQAFRPEQPKEQIPYVRLQTNETCGRPIVFVPGFTESITAKAGFILEMATQKADMIFPGQNRHALPRSGRKLHGATMAQAQNVLAVMRAEGLLHKPADFITHSYGSLVFQAMQERAHYDERTCFRESRVVMLTPAGMNPHETAPKLGRRFLANILAERRTNKDIEDKGGIMFAAGVLAARGNMVRSACEVRDLVKARLDYGRIMRSGIAELSIVAYAQDKLYPYDVLDEAAADAVSAGAVYWTPYSPEQQANGQPRGGQDASHNDEQFNPSRVATAVLDLLYGKQH